MIDLPDRRATRWPCTTFNPLDRGEGPSSRHVSNIDDMKPSAKPVLHQTLCPVSRRIVGRHMPPKPPEAYPPLEPLTMEKLRKLSDSERRSRGRIHRLNAKGTRPAETLPLYVSLDKPIPCPSGPRLDRGPSTTRYRRSREIKRIQKTVAELNRVSEYRPPTDQRKKKRPIDSKWACRLSRKYY